MTELNQELQDARVHLRSVDWSSQRAERVLSRIQHKQRRFTLSSVALGSAAIAVAIAITIVWFAQGGTGAGTQVAEQSLQLKDGTTAVALGGESSVRLSKETKELVTFDLDVGRGWFEVTPSATRKVEVRAEDVRVQVLGTEFVVEIEGDFVHVWVHRGRVRVTSANGTVELLKGDHGRFPANTPKEPKSPDPAVEGTETEPGPADTSEDSPSDQDDSDEDDSDGHDWDPDDSDDPELGERVVVSASDRPESSDPTTPSPTPNNGTGFKPIDEVSRYWKIADEARLKGNHRQAMTALTILIDEYPDDARLALAAFTLGRVLMDSRGNPQTAARAFAKARKASPNGPLVEDALLREVEAWFADGDARRVRRRSDKYLRLFPDGRYKRRIEELRSNR